MCAFFFFRSHYFFPLKSSADHPTRNVRHRGKTLQCKKEHFGFLTGQSRFASRYDHRELSYFYRLLNQIPASWLKYW